MVGLKLKLQNSKCDPVQFKELSQYYQKIEDISSRLKMIEILAEMFTKVNVNEISKVVYITQGALAAPYEGIEFGLSVKTAEDAISIATGISKKEIDDAYKKQGDLGDVAEILKSKSLLKRMSQSTYTVSMVYDSMLKIAKTSGKGSRDLKIRILADILAASTPLECKYIIRYPIGQLRLGVGDPTILEALSVASTGNREFKSKLENAYNICSDLGVLAERLFSKGVDAIESIDVTLFKPIRPALAERLPTSEQIIEKMGGTCAIEQKYDGFRCQVHKEGKKIKIYSRNLEETTEMFPDIVKAVQESITVENAILDGEALAFNESTNEFLPFQETIQRKRKHNIKEMSKQIPLHLMAFDVIYIDGCNYLNKPYSERREALKNIISKNSERVTLSKMLIVNSASNLDNFFHESIEGGLEGIVAKDLKAPYVAGARKFSWIKLKRSYRRAISDTLDLVIIGYYLGKGIRAEFNFGGLLCAVYNKTSDMFETISRIGTGFTEEKMKDLSIMLSKIIIKKKPARVNSLIEPDFWVRPIYVVTVLADEITRSSQHTCGKTPDGRLGYALRFPRLVGDELIRSDKNPEDATTTYEIEEIFGEQRKVNIK